MQPNRSMGYVLQVAVCTLCGQTVNLSTECYRENRVACGVVHVLCLAVLMTDADDGPRLSESEMVAAVNEAALELCVEYCENSHHTTTEG